MQVLCQKTTKGAGISQTAITAKVISSFVFATCLEQFLYFLDPKFPVSSQLLSLYSPVCVGPVRKPRCWFSHEAAHIIIIAAW